MRFISGILFVLVFIFISSMTMQAERVVRYGYDVVGNMVSRTLEVEEVEPTAMRSRDHLGSITHVYTAEPIPTLLQELSYDAWGRLRNPDTHEAYASDSIPTPILGRGYTGHRHIAGIGLIDMNARLYDPMLGRFLSADPHIQSPDCPQNYNRYSYCLNNPLKYVDILGLFATKAEAVEASKNYPGSTVGYDRDKGEWFVSYKTSRILIGVEYVRIFNDLYGYRYTDESISPSKGSGGSSMSDFIGYANFTSGALGASQSVKNFVIERYAQIDTKDVSKFLNVSKEITKRVGIANGIFVILDYALDAYENGYSNESTIKLGFDLVFSAIGILGGPIGGLLVHLTLC